METVRAMALSGCPANALSARFDICRTSPRTWIASAAHFRGCSSAKGFSTPDRGRICAREGALRVVAARSEDAESVGAVGVGAIAGGLVSVPVVAWSLYTLKTTGCGLPPGPGGAIGALEGVSYLVVLGVIGWSIYTKVKTGAGLPAGPFGLLGAVEGFSYLAFLAILVVFGLQALDYGFIPGPLPGKECFG